MVRDSAGVRIVEYAWGAGFTAFVRPCTGADLPAWPWPHRRLRFREHLAGPALPGRNCRPDGRRQLRSGAPHLPDGAEHSVLAVAGQGPGEVGYVIGMYTLGRDSLMVLDRRNSRLSLFVKRITGRRRSRSSNSSATPRYGPKASTLPVSSWRPPTHTAPGSRRNGFRATWPASIWIPGPSTPSRPTTSCRAPGILSAGFWLCGRGRRAVRLHTIGQAGSHLACGRTARSSRSCAGRPSRNI